MLLTETEYKTYTWKKPTCGCPPPKLQTQQETSNVYLKTLALSDNPDGKRKGSNFAYSLPSGGSLKHLL